jgi:hypothetical protein
MSACLYAVAEADPRDPGRRVTRDDDLLARRRL